MKRAQLDALTEALRLGEGFELHFAVVSSAAHEDAVVEHVRATAEGLGLTPVELHAVDAHDGSTRPPFAALLADTPAPRLTVLRTVQANIEDVQVLERCFLQVNPRRDAIAQRHRGPLVVVCRPDGLRHIVDVAPDFYSVHVGLWVIERASPRPQPSWMLFDHEAIGLLGLDPSLRVLDEQAIASFRLRPPAPMDGTYVPEPLSVALNGKLLDESERVLVTGPHLATLQALVAEVVRATPLGFDEVVWLDGEAAVSPMTLLHELVSGWASGAERPPSDPRDLERRFRALTASRSALIVVVGTAPSTPLPLPRRPSKLIELVATAEPVDDSVHVGADSRLIGALMAWSDASVEGEERRERWRWTRGLLDPRMSRERREQAERRARAASIEDVEAAATACVPLDAARFLAAVARLTGSKIDRGRYLVRAIELSLCVHAEVEVFEPWLRELEQIGEFSAHAAQLRFAMALRIDGNRAEALFHWEQLTPLSVEAEVRAMVRRIVLRDPDDVHVDGRAGPGVALVATLRHLASHEVDELLAHIDVMCSSWPQGARIVEHLGAASCCWIHLDHGRWEQARVALELAEVDAAAWGDPLALLRARLLRFYYDVTRGDLERAAEQLDELLERADERLGPLNPATVELLAEGVELHTLTARPERARALGDEVWQRLEYFDLNVNHAARPMLTRLMGWFGAHGHEDRVARMRQRWGWLLAGAASR